MKKNKQRTDSDGATKYDGDKIRLDLLPYDAIEEIGKVMTQGAKKYRDRNWEKGMTWSRLFASTLRHLFAFWRGEKVDPEFGISHLAHAGCCILFLLAHKMRKIGVDDRVKEESYLYQKNL